MIKTKKENKPKEVIPIEQLNALVDGGGDNRLKRIKIKDAMADLKIKDKRTFRKWCDSHGVEIIPDVGGAFVFEDEFRFKANKKVAEIMRVKYGDEWRDKLSNSEENQDSNNENSSDMVNQKPGYAAVSKTAIEFLKKSTEQRSKK